MTSGIFILILFVSGLAMLLGCRCRQCRSGSESHCDWVTPFLFVLAVLLLADFAAQIIDSPASNWNGVRLAPALGMRMGINVYPPLNSGVVTGHMYGPMAALMYVPATFFTNPATAIEAGNVLTAVFLLLPVVLWAKTVSGASPRLNMLQVVLLFLLLTMLLGSLDYVLHNIHADAPALFFAGLAGWLAFRFRQEAEWRKWILPAVLAVLAVWSKQTMTPLLLALPAGVWWLGRRLSAVRFTLLLAGCGVVLTGLFIAWFGFDRLWFNLVQFPAVFPWVLNVMSPDSPLVMGSNFSGRLQSAFWSAVDLLRESCLPLLLLAVSAGVRRVFGMRPAEVDNRAAIRFLLLLSVLLVPTSVLGRAKLGGALNCFSFTTFFLCLAVVLHAIGTWNRCAHHLYSLRPLLRRAMVGLTVLVLTALAWQKAVAVTFALERPPSYNEQAVAYLRRHPGEAYFPGQPLAHLMADKHYYHFSYAVMDLETAGLAIPEEQCRSGLPERMRIIFVYNSGYMRGLHCVSNFQRHQPPEEMKGWLCYVLPGKGS